MCALFSEDLTLRRLSGRRDIIIVPDFGGGSEIELGSGTNGGSGWVDVALDQGCFAAEFFFFAFAARPPQAHSQ